MANEWQKVFKAAVAVAKSLVKKNPNLKYFQAMKQAWKDPSIIKMKEEYKKKHGTAKKKGSGVARSRGRPKGSRSVKRRSVARKAPARKSTARKSKRKTTRRTKKK